jgi:hypothetical protein
MRRWWRSFRSFPTDCLQLRKQAPPVIRWRGLEKGAGFLLCPRRPISQRKGDSHTADLPLSDIAVYQPLSELRNCRGRDDHRWPPPAQIRTCAFTHTALTEDEWRRSACRDMDAERGVRESTGPAVG